MIKSISMINFQAHKNTRIDFTPGFNVITGNSDAGKSSVPRALNWVVNNRPLGDDVKNWYMKKGEAVSVSIELTDGTIIVKTLSNSVVYKILKPKKIRRRDSAAYDEQTFEAVNKDVPQEIRDAFNMSDINMQAQHEKYYMLNESPGNVAKRFNSLAGLDIIDTMFANINSFILRDKRDIDAGSATIAEINRNLSKLEFVEKAKQEVEKLAALEKDAARMEQELLELSEFQGSLNEIQANADKYNQIIAIEPNIEQLAGLQNKSHSLQIETEELTGILTGLKETQEQLNVEDEWLLLEPQYESLQTLSKQHHELIQERQVLSQALVNLTSIGSQLQRENDRHQSLTNQYRDLLLKNKNCPICGGPIDETCVQKILGQEV